MFNRLQLFRAAPHKAGDEQDARYFIQQYLQQQFKTSEIYCEEFSAGCATIRVANPTLQEAVWLVEWELKERLKKEAQFELKKIVVRG